MQKAHVCEIFNHLSECTLPVSRASKCCGLFTDCKHEYIWNVHMASCSTFIHKKKTLRKDCFINDTNYAIRDKLIRDKLQNIDAVSF